MKPPAWAARSVSTRLNAARLFSCSGRASASSVSRVMSAWAITTLFCWKFSMAVRMAVS
jgi:hypothetical protein